jgi:hypothetical protein
MEPKVSPETQSVIPGSPEYDALMAQKFDSQDNTDETVQPTGERPGWLPEKFKSPEDLAAAYTELEKKLSSGTKQEPVPAPQSTGDVEQARDVVVGAGLDFDALSEEFNSTGALSQESYASLEAKGFHRELVDAFIEGQKAIAVQFANEVTSTVGGAETYAEVTAWAAQNLTPAEIDAFNETVDSGNLAKAKLAVAALKAKYDAAVGSEPELLNGATNGDSGDVFRSTAELTAAMKDPRYKKDPAYRADVQAKLARSNIY